MSTINVNIKVTSKFQWMLGDIRIENINSTTVWATKIFLEVLTLLDVRHCPKLRSWKNDKNPNFGPDFGPFGPNLDP